MDCETLFHGRVSFDKLTAGFGLPGFTGSRSVVFTLFVCLVSYLY